MNAVSFRLVVSLAHARFYRISMSAKAVGGGRKPHIKNVVYTQEI
jgi:hypothetical protein